MNCDCYHIPVMLHECLAGLDIRPDGTYVDLTYGGGGHSREIVSLLGSKGHLFGFDQDLDAMKGAMTDERFTFVRSNFRFVGNWMQFYETKSGVTDTGKGMNCSVMVRDSEGRCIFIIFFV